MPKQILFCHCKSDLLPENRKHEISTLIGNLNVPITHLHDLCGLSVEKKAELNDLVGNSEDSLLIACHSRTIESLLNYAGINNYEEKIKTMNARDLSLEEINSELTAFAHLSNSVNTESHLSCESNWPSWFPVIDYSRCVACGQCADFCLFGTYSKTEQRVTVTSPQSCKNNCPACARICPHTAIIFPKYKQGGAISGSAFINEFEEMQQRQHDVSEILGNDIYKALAQRKTKRQRIIQNEVMQTAVKEREEALKEIKNKNSFNPFGNIKPI